VPTAFIEVNDASLHYGEDENPALDNTTLSIQQGEFVAIVGPSGCGKSSLLKLVSGLVLPSAGTVKVAGKKVDRPLSQVGMAFQNSILLPWRTALDNVMLPLEIVRAHRDKVRSDRTNYESKVSALLADVGLKGVEKLYPWQLSGGMQQRVSLCRALIHAPELLLLDEPFAALDAFTREELWDNLQQLWLKNRFTAILVTHDLREATYLADTIYVMSRRPGRILTRRENPLPRPRTQESSFSAPFVETVHELRGRIERTRNA
jgi:NitT/TauT family transport system ATP-binding protein